MDGGEDQVGDGKLIGMGVEEITCVGCLFGDFVAGRLNVGAGRGGY